MRVQEKFTDNQLFGDLAGRFEPFFPFLRHKWRSGTVGQARTLKQRSLCNAGARSSGGIPSCFIVRVAARPCFWLV
jgi:hypothetical protein